jgi:replicative DNA helicase Mcm
MESGAGIRDLHMGSMEGNFEKFFRMYYHKEILRVIQGYPETKSLVVDFNDLDRYDITLADELINNPDSTLIAAENALRNIELPFDVPTATINVRFTNLPASHTVMIRDLRSLDVGKFLAVEGIVRKVTDVRPKLVMGVFLCPNGHEKHEEQDGERLKEPFFCEECDRRTKFELLTTKSTFIDSQKILIQEDLEELRGGEHPKQLSVYLEDDLTGKIMPGDRVTIAGILRATKRVMKGGRSRVFEIFIEGNSYMPVELDFEEVEITKEEEREIKKLAKDPKVYEKIRDSIAPHIYGYKDIKEAIMYQLFSAPAMLLPDGGRIRGDSHIILIGEPATGKSEILQYVARELAPRGIYASGKGTSTAGLTATAVKDEFGEGGWSLEAGALVLADNGVACLTPGSKVVVNDEICRIEELFEETQKVRAISLGEEIEVCDLNLETVSMSNLKTLPSVSSRIRRKKYEGGVLEITFDSGFKVRLTPEHKLLHGDSLEWREAREFKKGEFVIAPLKLPDKKDDIFLLDILPDDWLAILSREDEEELRSRILKRCRLAEFNRRYGVSRNFLSGNSQVKVGILRKVLRDLGCYEEWRKKILGYGRKKSGEALKVSKITPEIAYFLGFLYGDGSVSVSWRGSEVSITQSTENESQLEAVKKAFSKFSNRQLRVYRRTTKCNIRGDKVESENLTLYAGSNLVAYLYEYITKDGLRNLLKLPDESLKAFIAGCLDSDGCLSIKRSRGYEVVHLEFQLSMDEERDKAFTLALRRFDCYAKLVKGKGINKIIVTGRDDVTTLLDAIRKYSVKTKDLPPRKHRGSSFSGKLPARLVAEVCREISSSLSKTTLLEHGVWSTIHAYMNKKYQPAREQLLKIDRRLSDLLSPEIRKKIHLLASRDYHLDRIVDIRKLDYAGYVYDLYVPGYRNFLCDGVLVHNCIDEFDKMEETDRAAMHEAMEQQQVSIAKAGMLATFRARCAILAAANPKYGRFDKYRPISEQVNLTPTILSRFDLIFFVEDELEDTRVVAKHILDTAVSPEANVPPIPSDFLRKYIAYARQNVSPILSPDARESIEDFYVEMREAAKNSEDIPIPLTARQLWAIIRLARASARVRLSDTTSVEDVERGIRLVKFSLEQAGMDTEAGKYDIDKIMVGITKSQRDRINEILHIIRYLEEEFGTAKKSEIMQRCEEKGISEEEAEKILEKLRRDGNIYEPRHGNFKIV